VAANLSDCDCWPASEAVQVEKLSPLGELSDEELELLEEYFASSRAKLVRKIERHNGAATDEKEQADFPLASPDSVDSK
jgi:hypothetical protein